MAIEGTASRRRCAKTCAVAPRTEDRTGARARVVGALAALLVVGVASACAVDAARAQRCSDIPPGGCPLSHGVACEDPACEATYACRPGNVWELAEHCPPREPTVRDGGGLEDAGAEAGPLDASVDAPPGAYGGPGCPSLIAPECALGVALACGSDCCGCEDLFVCRQGGWDLWGSCGPDGPTASLRAPRPEPAVTRP